MKTTTSYKKEFATFTGNASTTANTTNSLDNITWGLRMINDNIKYLATIFYFNETSYLIPGGTVASQQDYQLPGDFEQILNVTVKVGSVIYQPKESPSRQHWDSLNTIPYYSDFPQFYFIFNGKINLFPIPSSDSNVLTVNYKKRIVDLAMDDVTQTTSSQTLAITTATATVTASGSAFKSWMGISGWLQVPYSSTDAANGDNRWYQISSITSGTILTLKNNYTGASLTGGSFTIGDVPILPEDYQNIPLYNALRIYFSTRVSDPVKAAEFKALYTEGFELLNQKYGSKSNSPILTDTDTTVFNPNLFQMNLS